MTTTIRTDNGVDIEVCTLGLTVTDHDDEEAVWARLTPDQRAELAAALGTERATPGGQWTRDDLPDGSPLIHNDTLDAVVAHLNAHRPKPESPVEWLERELNSPDEQAQKMLHMDEARVEANIQRNRAIRERDAAVARAEQAERERDEWVSYGFQVGKLLRSHMDGLDGLTLIEMAERVASARDAAVARADSAEAACEGFKEYIDRFCKPAPSVSRADVDQAIYSVALDGGGSWTRRTHRLLVDAVCSLLQRKAEQAEDPVEAEVARHADTLAKVVGISTGSDDIPSEVREACRTISRHVLGQEATR